MAGPSHQEQISQCIAQPIHATALYPPRVSSLDRSFCEGQALPHTTALDAQYAGRHHRRHALRWARDCKQFAENAGNGCGASASVGRVERLFFERRMRSVLVGVGGIGVASPALSVVYVADSPRPRNLGNTDFIVSFTSSELF